MPAERIVTLLPSATEIVCALGLIDRIVGVTHECDYPPEVVGKPVVTQSILGHGMTSGAIDAAVREHLETANALYTIDQDTLARLSPDTLVTQALCEVCAVAEKEVASAAAALATCPVVVNLEPMTLDEVFETIERVGDVTGVKETADTCVRSLRGRVNTIRSRYEHLPDQPRVAFLEWIDPPFNAGHWTPELIEYAGGIDCLGNKHQPSRTITPDEIVASQPDVLIIALCGFDTTRATEDLEILKTSIAWDSMPAVRSGRVHVLDGNAYFSRPGPRLVDSLEVLAPLLHPGA